MARWRGGELTLARFLDTYDPGGAALLAGGEALLVAVAKATYLEIESARAEQLGVAEQPSVRAELAAGETAALAAFARGQLGLGTPANDQEIATAWATRHREIVPTTIELDLDVLFVRCPLRRTARATCQARMDELLSRAAQGEPWLALAAEEAERSGPANGHFQAASSSDLVEDLAEVATAIPVGEISGTIVSPSGLFALRVGRRVERPPLALEAVVPLVRQFLGAERERMTVASLPAPPHGEDTPEARLAAYARAAGLGNSVEFRRSWEARRRWLLADAAFARDPATQPSADEVRAAIAAEPDRWRRRSLLVAVLAAPREQRREALDRAARIADELGAAESAEASLTTLAEREPGVILRRLDGAGDAELATLDPLLREAIATLGGGKWSGPWPVAAPDAAAPARQSVVTRGARYAGLAFVLVRTVEGPDEAAVTAHLRQRRRAALGDSVESFMTRYGRDRGVELLVP